MRFAFGLALALLAAGCANEGTPEVQSPRSTNEARKDIVIQFGDMNVEPSVARVKQGGSVSWTSVSTNFLGTLSFPASIVDRFTCKELRPQFFMAGGRLVSSAIRNGDENITLPCPLQPGTYEYRIELTSGGEGIGGRAMGEDPQLSLKATLIVE